MMSYLYSQYIIRSFQHRVSPFTFPMWSGLQQEEKTARDGVQVSINCYPFPPLVIFFEKNNKRNGR